MKYGTWVVFFASLVIAVVVCMATSVIDRESFMVAGVQAGEQSSEKSAEKPAAKSSGPPPLVVNRSAPLLLDALPEEPSPKPEDGLVADNTACHCCHTNYKNEWLAVEHARANVGCMKCHGECYEHRDDEDNVTPPDIMYSPEMIGPACGKCHDTHDVPAAEVITRWQQRCPGKEKPDEIVCTDCHGEHRLKFRTVWWDKKTRQLVVRGEQRIKLAPDYTKKKNDRSSGPEQEIVEMQ